MAIQTEVSIDGVSLGTPLNNRVEGFWTLEYYVKDEEGLYTYSSEYGSPDEINDRVKVLRKYPKIFSWLVIIEPETQQNGEEVIIMDFENSLKDINGEPVGKK